MCCRLTRGVTSIKHFVCPSVALCCSSIRPYVRQIWGEHLSVLGELVIIMHHTSSFKFQYAIFYHITMFLRIVFVETWGSHHWKPQIWKLPDRRGWTLLPHDSTGKLPRYRINHFDRYRITLNKCIFPRIQIPSEQQNLNPWSEHHHYSQSVFNGIKIINSINSEVFWIYRDQFR